MVGRECEFGEFYEFYEFFLSLVVVCEFWANLAEGGKGMRIWRIERILRIFFKLGYGLRILGEWERIIKKENSLNS